MAISKSNRSKKKQLGQFMTPIETCFEIVSKKKFKITDKVLEPSFGTGNFILTIIDKFIELYEGDIEYKLTKILNDNIWGVELDDILYEECVSRIKDKWGFFPINNNLYSGDFLLKTIDIKFNHIIGNPPFGGTIKNEQELLDKKYGTRMGLKIKKETYSFFMIKSIEMLSDGGELTFISSDTFLTINTMSGLRKYLFENGTNHIQSIEYFSEETNYPMVILNHRKSNKINNITIDGIDVSEDHMNLTKNFSWVIYDDFISYLNNPLLSDYITTSGGMTTGKNEYFIREIKDGKITEEYNFDFYESPITLEEEIYRAKNNYLSVNKTKEIKELENNGETKRKVNIHKRVEPISIEIPHPDYKYYNKASNEILYTEPENVIYWKDNGDACYTFKKTGKWYLGGVGGKPFFERECLTWQLISSRINPRYLPEGFILDNSSPILVLNEGIDKDELYFILGWLISKKSTLILKNIINHTKNIQGKDIEKLPYPIWVSDSDKAIIIKLVKDTLEQKIEGLLDKDKEKFFVNVINKLFTKLNTKQ